MRRKDVAGERGLRDRDGSRETVDSPLICPYPPMSLFLHDNFPYLALSIGDIGPVNDNSLSDTGFFYNNSDWIGIT